MNFIKTFLTLSIASLILLLSMSFSVQDSTKSINYCNARYDFCVEYPQAIFKTIKKSSNADGVYAISISGDQELIVAGYYNVLNVDIEEEYETFLAAISDDKKTLTIQDVRKDKYFFEVAILMNGKWTYKKVLQQNDKFIALTIRTNNYEDLNLLKEEVQLILTI